MCVWEQPAILTQTFSHSSIRIPSAFCGLYGLRPSYGRVPYAGAVNSMEGQDSVPSVFGPLCNSLAGVKIFMKAVIDSKPWLKDPLVVRKKWDEDEYKLEDHGRGKGLVFGICWDNGVKVPHPPIIRALEMTKAALEAAGHKVVDWVPYKHAELCNTLVSSMADSRCGYLVLHVRCTQNDIWSAGCLEDYDSVTSISGEPLIETMLAEAYGEIAKTNFRPTENANVSAYGLWQLQKVKLKLRQEYLALWEDTAKTTGTGRPVDAIISPVAPYAAPPHGTNTSVILFTCFLRVHFLSSFGFRDASYTSIYNVLDYPSCVFPVTRVDPTKDAKRPPHKFLSKEDEDNYKFCTIYPIRRVEPVC